MPVRTRGWIFAVIIMLSVISGTRADEMPEMEEKRSLPEVIESVLDSVARVNPLDGELAVKEDSNETSNQKSSIGSGILIDARGYVLTNLHVISDATQVRIKFPGKRAIVATQILKDERTDIAVLKVDATKVEGIAPITIHDSEDVPLGTEVFAIGVPYGFESTVSRGIVSGKDRFLKVKKYIKYLQTDAAINPGNSGGPLVCCSNGKCIGVVNAIHSNSGSNIGIAFVISGEQAKFVADQLIKNGKVIRGYMGAAFVELSDDKFDALDLHSGVEVSRVVEGNSPAQLAGVKVGDIVLKYQGKTVTSVNMLIHEIATTPIDSTASIVIFRDSEEISLDIKVTAHPNS